MYHSILHIHHSLIILIIYPQKFLLSRAPFGPISPQTFVGNLFPENVVYLPQLSNKKIRLYNFVVNKLEQLTGTVNQSYFRKIFSIFVSFWRRLTTFFLSKTLLRRCRLILLNGKMSRDAKSVFCKNGG